MTLVDTSVWIDHLRRPNSELAVLLEAEQVLTHPFVLGELSLGQSRQEGLLWGLRVLEPAPLLPEYEVTTLVRRFQLWGRGIGWVDCHLLASARAVHARLMTQDKALRAAWAWVGGKG